MPLEVYGDIILMFRMDRTEETFPGNDSTSIYFSQKSFISDGCFSSLHLIMQVRVKDIWILFALTIQNYNLAENLQGM